MAIVIAAGLPMLGSAELQAEIVQASLDGLAWAQSLEVFESDEERKFTHETEKR